MKRLTLTIFLSFLLVFPAWAEGQAQMQRRNSGARLSLEEEEEVIWILRGENRLTETTKKQRRRKNADITSKEERKRKQVQIKKRRRKQAAQGEQDKGSDLDKQRIAKKLKQMYPHLNRRQIYWAIENHFERVMWNIKHAGK